MKQIRLNVILPKNRNISGALRIEIDGRPVSEYKVLGRGSRGPGDTSMLNRGNTPTGVYSGNSVVDTGDWPQDSYGPWGAVRLQPQSGNSVIAERNGRSGLLIHGGATGGANYWRGAGALRATYGCLRLSNEDMKDLVEKIYSTRHDEIQQMSVQTNITVDVQEW